MSSTLQCAVKCLACRGLAWEPLSLPLGSHCLTFCNKCDKFTTHQVVSRDEPAVQVDHPPHYGGDKSYEAIKVIEAWSLGFCLGNVVKYISRAGRKPGATELDDLRKARWYLDRYIANLEGK